MMQATDDLIHSLSGHAGQGGDATSLRRFLLIALFLSFAAATLLVWTVFGFREDFAAMAKGSPFLFKASGAAALAIGAFLLARRAALPASGPLSVALLIPGLVPFALFALLDPAGADTVSAAWCSADIGLLSLPALGLILAAMKKGAPTNPAKAGAIAGLLAGSLASGAHALACHNDRGLSVLLWYGLAIALLSGLGSLIGRRVLRW
jgi:hypothetical protein